MIRRMTGAFSLILCTLLASTVIGPPPAAIAGGDPVVDPVEDPNADWNALAGLDPAFLGFVTPPENQSAPHDTVVYGGLVHIGLAHLEYNPDKNILGIPSDPATGRLGMTTLLGIATAFQQEWLPFNVEESETPAFIENIFLTQNQGAAESEHVLGGSRVTHGAGGLQYGANYSAMGATGYTVEIYLEGKLVGGANGLTDPPFVTTSIWPSSGGIMLFESGGDDYQATSSPASRWGMSTETPILIVDLRYGAGGPIVGDEIRLIPEGIPFGTPYITRSILRGREIEILEISGETVEGQSKRGFETPATPAASSSALTLVASPNPAPGGAARILFAAAANVPAARLAIYDASGRSVRALSGVAIAGRSGSLAWDGRDDAGRDVPAGPYFLRLTAGGEAATERLTVLR